MKLIYTEQAYLSLEEMLLFLKAQGFNQSQLKALSARIFSKANQLLQVPYSGQKEDYLEHLKLEYRRLVEGHCKIIYRVENQHIFIIDIFDSRQDPKKMKG